MRHIMRIIIFGALAYAGNAVWQNHGQKSIEHAPTPDSMAIASPTPRIIFAPVGTYFLRQRVSITTASGVIGDPPGTKVLLVNAGPPMQVTDGQNVFDVQPSQVTNELIDTGLASVATDSSTYQGVADMPNAEAPVYYTAGGVEYYYGGGYYYYYHNHQRIFINHLPQGGYFNSKHPSFVSLNNTIFTTSSQNSNGHSNRTRQNAQQSRTQRQALQASQQVTHTQAIAARPQPVATQQRQVFKQVNPNSAVNSRGQVYSY